MKPQGAKESKGVGRIKITHQQWSKGTNFQLQMSPGDVTNNMVTVVKQCFTYLKVAKGVNQRRQWHPAPVPLPGIPWMEEPGGLPSMGSHRVGHD